MIVSTLNENALEQLLIRIDDKLSMRIDDNSDEILRLRERSHDMETTIPIIGAAVDKHSEQLMKIFENQSKLDDKIILRIEKVEKVTEGIMLAAKHWKSILTIIILAIVVGFSVDNGLKDVIKTFVPDRAIKTAQAIANG